MPDLPCDPLNVANVGVEFFSENIETAGGSSTHIDWQPPARGDADMGKALAALVNNPIVEAANKVAFDRYHDANPVVDGIGRARDDIPDMDDRIILHAGAPVAWEDMCGPMKGAILGATVYEGWAQNLIEAEQLAASGAIIFDSCHHHNAVGPMAGVISPSMPVWKVTNSEHGNNAYCTLNEGLGKVLRFGANSDDVLDRLKWMENVLAPTLAKTLEKTGAIELKPLIAQALHMGDEVHNRNAAGSSLLIKNSLSARSILMPHKVTSRIWCLSLPGMITFFSIFPCRPPNACSMRPMALPAVPWSPQWPATALCSAYG